jgi:hypothetical protein
LFLKVVDVDRAGVLRLDEFVDVLAGDGRNCVEEGFL